MIDLLILIILVLMVLENPDTKQRATRAGKRLAGLFK